MKKVSLFILAFCIIANIANGQTNCNNVDFESGNFNNWTGYTGSCCPIITTATGIVFGRQTLMSGTGFDAVINTIPTVSPNGGVYSVRLGNSNVGSEAERLVYTMNVSPSNSNFLYQYAVILQDPGHQPVDQPRFEVEITDQAGQPIACGTYNVVAGANIPGFQTNQLLNVIYKNWSSVSVDLSQYIGQTVTIKFSTGDCGIGGHFGYAYIDCACTPLQLDVDFCFGSPQAVLNAPPGYQHYSWNTGDTTQSITILNPVIGMSYTVTMIPFQSSSCSSVLNFVLTPSAGFNAHFTYNLTCGQSQVQFNDSSYSTFNSSLPVSWFWDFGDGLTSTSQNPVHNYTAPGIYTITFIGTSPSGCSDTMIQTINIPAVISTNTGVNSDFNGYSVSCSNSLDGIASIAVTGGIPPFTYSWNTSPTQSNDTISGLGSGTYICMVTDSMGCQISDSVSLTGPYPLDGNISSTLVSCTGNDGSATELVTGGVQPYNYSWNTIPVQTGATATNLIVGTYICNVTDANNCPLADTTIVNGYLPLTISSTITNVSCFGGSDGSVVLSIANGNPPYSYLWQNGSTNSSINNVPYGNYTVTISDSSNCPGQNFTYYVSQPTQLIATPVSTPASCLIAQDGTATVIVNGGTFPYSFQWNTPTNQNDSLVNNLQTGTYNVLITDSHGCQTTVFDSVSFNPDFTVDAGIDRLIKVATPVQLVATPSRVGNFSYNWIPVQYLNNPSIINPIATPYTPIEYTLICTEDVGCIATDSVFIDIIGEAVLPNAFSPNQDGHNDEIFPIIIGSNVTIKEFKIYNRWGQLIFKSTSTPWDGTFNNKDCEVGAYVYILNYSNSLKEDNIIQGNITLIR